MQKVFTASDLVLPILKIPDPCPVRVEITDEYVYLFVGSRDWQWRLSDGECIGTGCGLCALDVAREQGVQLTDGGLPNLDGDSAPAAISG